VQQGVPLTIHRDGAPRINPVHIEDVVAAVERIVAAPRTYSIYNLSGDETLSFLDIVSLFESRHGRKAVLSSSEQDHGDLLGTNRLLRSELGWSPARKIAA
jgi:nucleoside-diphosphate-sugar epimerase